MRCRCTEEDLELSVYRMDTGDVLPDDDGVDSFWKGRFPATIGYLVEVGEANAETDYALEVEVPRRLYFDAETSAANVTSVAAPEELIAYLIEGTQGQILAAEL